MINEKAVARAIAEGDAAMADSENGCIALTNRDYKVLRDAATELLRLQREQEKTS